MRPSKNEQFADPKDTAWNGRLLRTYGISLHEYMAMLLEQGGACAICGYIPKPGKQGLHVDHDHGLKGKEAVRGLICWFCNRLLGLIERRRVPVFFVIRYFQAFRERCPAAAKERYDAYLKEDQ